MRIINDAFRQVAQARIGSVAEPSVPRPSVARLSREEVDRIVKGIGTDGPINWVLDALRIDWTPSVSRNVTRLRMSATIAWGLAILSEIGRQWAGIGAERMPWPWLPLATFVVALVVLHLTLPRE